MISIITKWLVLWSMWPALSLCQKTPIQTLSDGSQVRGTFSPDGSYQQYFGIPYASSEYKYRFQAPGPAPIWDGILEAINKDIVCAQIARNSEVVGLEDCLVLNVFCPFQVWDGTPLPVMVHIHGGGFQNGSGVSQVQGPEYLVARSAVLVTFNYRLNVNGFLCLGIKEAPGNAGFKDQVAALKWVQRNIQKFGGNPDNVTIFGNSAGGSSVSYHLLSPMSKGLFHKAIVQAGSSIALWARQRDLLGTATSLAKALGHEATDPHDLYRFFMKTTFNDLVSAKILPKKGLLQFMTEMPYRPCTERQIDGVEAFITDTPYNILTRGDYNKVPVIIGVNDQEGYVFVANERDESLSNISFKAILEDFDFDFHSKKQRFEAAQQLQKLYMGDDEISRKNILRLSKLYGEPYLNLPVIIETDLLVKTNDQPVYSYLFKYSGWRNCVKMRLSPTFWNAPGATHGDEGCYLFGVTSLTTNLESRMVHTMTSLWTNFAKYGTPTPEGSELQWPPATVSAQNRLEITAEPYITPVVQHPPTLQYLLYLYDKYRAL